MSDPFDARAWLAKADDDYQTALSALRRKRPLTSIAAFHAQQCAEKYLKGLLVRQGVTPPKIHDLNLLSDLCEQAGIVVPVDEDLLSLLTKAAVTFRYPGEEPTVEEARAALETAKAVRRFARTLIP